MNVIHAVIALFGACSFYLYAVVARAMGDVSRTSSVPLLLPSPESRTRSRRRASLRPVVRKQSQAGTTYCVVDEHRIVPSTEEPRRLSRRPIFARASTPAAARVSGFRRRVRASIRAKSSMAPSSGVQIPRLRTLRISDFYTPETHQSLEVEETTPRAAGDKSRRR